MSRRVPQLPAESELEVLSVLWREGSLTVRQVHEILQAGGRETTMTTTLKTMQIMVEKGSLTRSDTRPHVYSPTAPALETQTGLLKNLARKAFDGSVGKLLLTAVRDSGLSDGELQEIRRLLDSIRRTNKGGGK